MSLFVTALTILAVVQPADCRTVRLGFDIPAQSLSSALIEFGDQADVSVGVAVGTPVDGVETKGVLGTYTVDQAMTELLSGTGLEHTWSESGSIMVRAQAAAPARPGPPGEDTPGQELQQAESEGEQGPAETVDDIVKRKFSGDITVTASRREVNIRELPASVAVTEGADLEAIGVVSMDDYVYQVAGVNYIDTGPQWDSLTIRGITTATYSNLNQKPVGTYINEIPVTDYFVTMSTFDLGGFDFDRVEFLKGPQGTLYGAASLGGTMRYILNMPNVDRNEGALHLTTQVVEDGGVNWLAQGMFNVVLADGRFALRGVAGYQDDAGWIDNAYTGEENWNAYDQTNLRLMARWQPTDNVRLDLTYLDVTSNLGDYVGVVEGEDLDNPATAIDDGGLIKADRSFDQSIANITLTWDLGFAELVSSTSYLDKSTPFNAATGGKIATDTSLAVWGLLMAFGIDVPPEYITDNLTNFANDADPMAGDAWYQEIRLVSRDTGRFDWLAGVFYANASQATTQTFRAPGAEDLINAVAPPWGTLLMPGDVAVDFDWWDDATELSLYGEFGIDLSDRWKLTLGGRYTDWNRDSYMHLTQFGFLVDQEIQPPTFDETVFSPKGSISFRANDDTLWYALASKGYRTGGANTVYIASQGEREDQYYFDTDNLWNYETGVKKSWNDGKFITDLTLFYLDWTDIQMEENFYDPVLGAINAIFNTSAAHSVGAELTFTAQLARGLTFNTNITYIEAELDEPTPPVLDSISGEFIVVPAGARIPATPEWSTFSTLQYFWDNRKLGFPFIALDHYYKDTIVVFLTSQNTIPAWDTFGLRMGATFAKGLNITLAVRNLTDTRAWMTQDPPASYSFLPGMTPVSGFITQPRAVSLTIQKNF